MLLLGSFAVAATGPKGQAQPATNEQRHVQRECSGVNAQFLAELQEFARASAEQGSAHGRVVTEARGWVKTRQLEAHIPDKCVAAIVREIMAQYHVKREAAEARRREEAEAENKKKWDALTEVERRWILVKRASGPTRPVLNCNTTKLAVQRKVAIQTRADSMEVDAAS